VSLAAHRDRIGDVVRAEEEEADAEVMIRLGVRWSAATNERQALGSVVPRTWTSRKWQAAPIEIARKTQAAVKSIAGITTSPWWLATSTR
jgi:hypothetical protein